MITSSIGVELEHAISSRDEEALEDTLNACFAVEHAESLVPHLVRLLKADWHFRHEDVASLLQRIRSPAAVASLIEAATLKFPYLQYNNSLAFARKCVWALADTGTVEAREGLRKLAAAADADIAAYAAKRLAQWDAETHRKTRC
jgi:hypothetical protein